MNKLYVFAVGGSGERVMNSLVMLLAAGMKVGANEIVPVFIDNDIKSHALKTSLERIEYYNGNTAAKKGFYEICEWARRQGRDVSYCPVKIATPIVLSKNDDGAAIINLDRVIGPLDYRKQFEDEIKIEKDLLFTDNDLKMPLDVGFIGNPNVGSVVMNCTSLNNEDFYSIYNEVGSQDGVIVVGSLFGGTGAVGIHLIVDRFLQKGDNRPTVAGLSVLPYFKCYGADYRELNVDLRDYVVDVDSQDAKTRAALIYYDQYMGCLDYLYYVGDGGENKATYSYCIGGNRQDNPSHVVELMSALSVIDFSKRDKISNVVYKSPIWEVVDSSPNILNISGILMDDLSRSLIKFQLMKAIFEEDGMMNFYVSQNAPFVRSIGFSPDKLNGLNGRNEPKGEPYWGIWHMFKEWKQWTDEMKCDSNYYRKFLLYNDEHNIAAKKINEMITTLFYTSREGEEKNFGIAKSKTEGIFIRRLVPQNPEIMKELINACVSVGDNGRDVPCDPDYMPKMMSYMSVAIDNVLDRACTNEHISNGTKLVFLDRAEDMYAVSAQCDDDGFACFCGDVNPLSIRALVNRLYTPLMGKLANIPSPYAQMHTEFAFYEYNCNGPDSLSDDYRKAISNCLDIFELIYHSHDLDLREKGITLQRIKLYTGKENELIDLNAKTKVYLEALELYRKQYRCLIDWMVRADNISYHFDFKSLYVLKYKGKVFAAASPFTGFFTKSDCDLNDADIRIENNSRRLLSGYNRDWCLFEGRDSDFIIFMYSLLVKTNLQYVFEDMFEALKRQVARIDKDYGIKFGGDYFDQTYPQFNIDKDLPIDTDNVDFTNLKYILYL